MITTATDGAGLFAVDEWAKSQRLSYVGIKRQRRFRRLFLREETWVFKANFLYRMRFQMGFYEGMRELGIFITVGVKTPLKLRSGWYPLLSFWGLAAAGERTLKRLAMPWRTHFSNMA